MKIKAVLAADTPEVSLYFMIYPVDPSLDGVLLEKQDDAMRLVPFWSYISRMPNGIIKETDFHRQLLSSLPDDNWQKKFYFHSLPITGVDLASAKQYVKILSIPVLTASLNYAGDRLDKF